MRHDIADGVIELSRVLGWLKVTEIYFFANCMLSERHEIHSPRDSVVHLLLLRDDISLVSFMFTATHSFNWQLLHLIMSILFFTYLTKFQTNTIEYFF